MAQSACHEPMWVEEKGTSADPADTTIVCGCGRSLSLQDPFSLAALAIAAASGRGCSTAIPNGCDQNLKLLTRTATNTYFPQVYTVISLPTEEDELTQLVDELSGEFEQRPVARRMWRRPSASIPKSPRRSAPMPTRISSSGCSGFAKERRRSPEPVPEAFGVRRVRKRTPGDRPKSSDGEALRANAAARGLGDPEAGLDLSAIRNLVAVHRLARGVVPLWLHAVRGGTDVADGEIEDMQLAVRGAPISRDADWLPAIEQFGEGIFIHFDEAAIGRWLRATRPRAAP